ncbi:mechanosensitive ion channel family protein [Shewanella alkalitolerans]|uniref:mechanosensitive ion channel domain-containing protein n=1 Tax=Shewanella alkalitolerans TaxID=2864209 RepID=UPI001C658384|nr:mechanosensitive ion channel domain-containing protein [Shewanella alkalitolerans]QYJ98419.1 mechanosensitive ion channel family protein [Shewanella alkalitolerans]
MTQTLLVSCLYIGIFIFAQRLLTNWIAKLAESKQVSFKRTKMVTQYITYLLFIIIACLWVISLGIEYQQVSLFISSVFAVLGVALVAQWSILSNITAGILIFFVFPYRIGDRIKIIDKDEDVSGIIAEISLFHVLIERSDGITITYPNNLMLQKGVLKLTQAYTQAKPLSESPEKDHTQVQSD